jgi:uncharacterized protein (TIGR02453 family)
LSFGGIPADGFAFLRELAAEQNKPWFEANKPRYEASLRVPMAALVESAAAAFAERRIPLEGDGKRSVFRIHRDVRFSANKQPYKTNAGAVWFRPGGKRNGIGIVYVNVEPDRCFLASGFYLPAPPVLDALRAAIKARPQAWRKVEADITRAGFAFDHGDPLARMPRGYEALADDPVAPALRRRMHVVRMSLPESALRSAESISMIADFAEAMLPLLRFGWRALDEAAKAGGI